MTVHDDSYYASVATIAGKAALSGDATGRAVMPMSTGWRRFHPAVPVIWVDDAEGKPHGLTPKQYAVLTIVMDTIAAGTHPTMTKLARSLGYSVSTVSRAMVKLAAWGLIGYVVGRGRYAGMVIFRRVQNDGLDRLRRVAKAKMRRWYQASQDGISRLRFNVATYKPTTTYGVYDHVSGTTSTDTVMVATLKREWRDDEIAEFV